MSAPSSSATWLTVLLLVGSLMSMCVIPTISAERFKIKTALSLREAQDGTFPTWDNTDMMNFLTYSSAAYCNASCLADWNCGMMGNPVLTDYKITNMLIDTTQSLQGYAGYSDSLQANIISFRGTMPGDLENWIVDLHTTTTQPWPNVPNATVHAGFYAAYYDQLRNQVLPVIATLTKQNPSYSVWITGHSLGAAIGELCALDLTEQGYSVSSYSYGTPRVGNPGFAVYYNTKVTWNVRVINYNDLVPHLPPQAFGFEHADFELWNNALPNGTLVECTGGEDPYCADSVPDIELSISSHLTYFGMDMGDCLDYTG
eukprot:TRINITY_DN488_c0_g5_i2.p1 TRINITY_DN488_c0_g5~~TRINITY_DN488_c0_g5_i2.p1  ORF type:complete len:315 (+),score=44.55 TRINITY_DN488_c0_g5_i2:173-1117(+)